MHPFRARTLRHATLLASLASLLLTSGIALAGGAPTTTVEAGAFVDYVAPDPGGPTQGAIRFGFDGTLEAIAADAELVPPADTNLAFLNGGTPTCLEVTRDGGGITRLAFVAECTVSGAVEVVEDALGPDQDGYLIAGRLIAPAQFLIDSPAFETLIGVPASAGTVLAVTFSVDVDFGFPTTFVGVTSASGPVTLLAGGDIGVDGATLPSEVIDSGSRAALTDAANLGVDAQVEITGTGNLQVKSDMPELEVVLAVTYSAPPPSVPPTPSATPSPSAGLLPDTSLHPAGDSGHAGPPSVVAALLALLLVAAAGGFVRAIARH